jgi:aldehyde:ferredoxin oxidoreductase
MSEIIANSLGLCRLSILEKSNTHKIFAMYNKLFQMATGLSLNPSELRRIAQRSYAVERLLNIRETPVNGRPASAANLFDTPTGLQMTRPAWENLELKRFRQLVTRKFREQGWDKKLIVKLKVFKDLEIEELWPLMK